MTRWFPKEEVTPGVAKYLDIILYSREQIRKENEATGKLNHDNQTLWGIIYVKAQDADFELPMDPITIMRNALDKQEGGSGVPCDHVKYMESVKYWRHHAFIQ